MDVFFIIDELETQTMSKKHMDPSSESESVMKHQVPNEIDYSKINSYQAILVYPIDEECNIRETWHSSLSVSLHHPIFIQVSVSTNDNNAAYSEENMYKHLKLLII